VRLDPDAERLATDCPGGKGEKVVLRLVNRRVQFLSVEHQAGLKRRVTDALVPIDERMI
jgi:hypothetical protein